VAAPPALVGGARVVCWTPIDVRHRHTGNTEQRSHGVLLDPAAALVIGQYEGETAFYLFGCESSWRPQSDTWHQTLAEAKAQAEFEHEGVSATWQGPQR
jgi:hypothetical protein